MITVAGRAAGLRQLRRRHAATAPSDVLGLHLAAGSLPFYLTSFATIASAFLLPVVGALVDRSGRKKWHMAAFAWAGSFFAALLFFMRGDQWQLGAVAIVLSSILGGCSLVSYYAILVDISTEDERDRVSSHGWAFGYLGGGLLLALNLVMVLAARHLRARQGAGGPPLAAVGRAVVGGLHDHPGPPAARPPAAKGVLPETGGLLHRSFGQLFTTLREMRGFPMTLTFLVAFLFYNDGIQTVIGVASTYGAEAARLRRRRPDRHDPADPVRGVRRRARLRAAGRDGTAPTAASCGGIYAWMVIVVLAMFLPRGNVATFLLIGVAIAIVLGGTQALSRSFFSLLIPHGREGEYFALYNACERGTSWFGTFLFGVVFQVTGSYRPAIVALIVFFVLGAVFLLRLDPARGVAEAGNALPVRV